jgi:hypothetical protein
MMSMEKVCLAVLLDYRSDVMCLFIQEFLITPFRFDTSVSSTASFRKEDLDGERVVFETLKKKIAESTHADSFKLSFEVECSGQEDLNWILSIYEKQDEYHWKLHCRPEGSPGETPVLASQIMKGLANKPKPSLGATSNVLNNCRNGSAPEGDPFPPDKRSAGDEAEATWGGRTYELSNFPSPTLSKVSSFSAENCDESSNIGCVTRAGLKTTGLSDDEGTNNFSANEVRFLKVKPASECDDSIVVLEGKQSFLPPRKRSKSVHHSNAGSVASSSMKADPSAASSSTGNNPSPQPMTLNGKRLDIAVAIARLAKSGYNKDIPLKYAALLARYPSDKNEGFKKMIGTMRTALLVDPTSHQLTTKGTQALQGIGRKIEAVSNKEIFDLIKATKCFGPVHRKIMDILVDGKPMMVTLLAQKAGYNSENASGFKKALSFTKNSDKDRMAVVESTHSHENDQVQLTDLAFPFGRPA